MDFSFSADQIAIRDLAQQIFTDSATDEFLLSFDRNDDVYDNTLWKTLGEQGLLGITIPEEFGGTGLGLTELCMLLEEQGRRVAPIPLFASLVLGALPIIEFGSTAQKEKYLTPLASGDKKLTAAISELGVSQAAAGRINASQKGEQWILNGQLDFVVDGLYADAILVPATNSDGKQTVFIIDSEQLALTGQQSSLGLKEASITLNNVTVNSDAVLGNAGDGESILAWLELRAELALCAQQVGITEEAVKRTAEFTCERKQFGAPIGSFQAVAMQAADAYIDVEAIRSSYWLALYKIESAQDARSEVRIAKWYAAEAGHRVVYRTQHLHGGIGADIEYPIHRYFLWAKHVGMILGGRSVQIEKLGALLASDDSIGLQSLRV
ncbi:acyl-CoA dehydrogenase family protein [Oceanicoccus sp. KOV_DT_Chl]|uniref:acyl-CoA dehydrogenase family protein n=1 Tax=Oceanicoccus sp. KOV_DT_Chl TaxID=1904639 RepID=UPI000C7CDBC1|nr:acyl-CoA dehydrogenase family protein [Oceanicoccus sp. KOV_DT_Chl]